MPLFAGLLVLCLLLLDLLKLQSTPESPLLSGDAEAIRAAKILRTNFTSAYGDSVILVVSGLTGSKVLLRKTLDRVLKEIEADPGVEQTISYRNTQDTLFLGRNGRGFVVVVGLADSVEPDARDSLLARLRMRTDRVLSELRDTSPLLAMRWTGESLLDSDLWNISAQEARQAELRILPLVLVVLVVTFGSFVAATIPVSIGLASVLFALGATATIGHWFPLSSVLTSVVTMMGLGLGVDYALLMVSRFREELAPSQCTVSAARITADNAGRTITLSSCAVATGFIVLLIVPNKDMRSIAVGGIIVLAIAALLAAKVLPALLMRLGSRVNALGVKIVVGPSRLPGLFRWWARVIFAHPRRIFALGLLPILLLAMQSWRLDVRLPRGDWLPKSAPSVQAIEDLKGLGRVGMFQAIEIVVTLPPGEHLFAEIGWRRIAALCRRLEGDSRIQSVRSIMAAGVGEKPWESLSEIPQELTSTFTSVDRTKVLVVVVPKAGQEIEDLSQLVRDVRTNYARSDSLSGGPVAVGGVLAQSVDDDNVVRHRFPIVILAMLLVTFGILAWSFRSLFLALKATVLNGLSVAAAFGALVLVFQDGNGSSLIGLAGPTAGVFPNIPILVFCIVFGLSMDYEVFLFSRVREAHRRGLSDFEGMAAALETTAGVLTSAALIMMIVFIGFCWGEFLLIKMLGFTLTVAVFIDVTLIRLILGPALFAWAGRWNWWPGS